MPKNNGTIGSLFEEVFLTMLDDIGFKEDIDYVRGKMPDPDFYFPKSNTYIEIKATSNGHLAYSEHQKKRFKELIEKGYKVKTIVFEIKICNAISENHKSIMRFIEELSD